VSAGLSPNDFWEQTPATFDAIMAGARKRIELQAEGALATVHAAAQFNALASHGKLKPLKSYTAQRPSKAGAEMLATLRQLQSRGAKMNIRRVGDGD